MFINNLKVNQELIKQAFFVLDIEKRIAKNNNPFLKFMLGDGLREIPGYFFNEFSEEEYRDIKNAKAIYINGSVGTFNNKLKIDIDYCETTNEIENMLPSLEEEKLETIKIKYKELKKQLNNPELKVLELVEERLEDKYFKAPGASRNHHAYLGGLAEHSVKMTLAALRIASVYIDNVEIDLSLLILGGLVHDIGKIWENDFSSFPFTKTSKTQLIGGHIPIGLQFIGKICADVKYSKREVLEHIIAAHHDLKEWGTLIEARTIEACIIAKVDFIDYFITRYGMIISEGVDEQGFSDFDKTMQRKLHRGK